MPTTRMDSRMEALENSVARISSLSATVVELKGDMEHLNARLGTELEKLNEKLEVGLALGRRELNEGLQTIGKMVKGLSLDPSIMSGEGSGMRSTAFVEKRSDLESTPNLEIPTKLDAIGVDPKHRDHREELGKAENQDHKLEVPAFNGRNPDKWIFEKAQFWRTF